MAASPMAAAATPAPHAPADARTANAAAAPPASSSSSSSTRKDKSGGGLGLTYMLAGSLSGMGSRTILQPLDLVKVRLQVQDGSGRNEYKGFADGIRQILRADGFFGLYRGLAPNLIASGVSWGCYFFTYNHAKNMWRQHILPRQQARAPPDPNQKPGQLGPVAHLSCAALSGTCATFFTNPLALVKIRLQLQGKEVNSNTRVYKGVVDAFVRIVREEGFFTLYRGIGPSLALVSNGALQFMGYEELKKLTVKHLIPSRDERELNSFHFLTMGALAKVFSATATYPMAVTRARLYQRKPDDLVKAAEARVAAPAGGAMLLQANGGGGAAMLRSAPAAPKAVDGKYHSVSDVVTKIWRLEGWRGFYRGLGVMLCKTAPSSAITFLIYESTIKLLHADKGN